MSYQDPLGQPPEPVSAAPPPYPGPAYQGYVLQRPTNGLAIAAMVVSIAGLAMCPIVVCAVGAVLGHMARKQISETGEEGDGFALAGIIVGWIGFGLSLLAVLAYVGFVVFVLSTSNTY